MLRRFAIQGHERAWCLALLLLVTWLGARGLGADDLWFDEYRTMWYAGAAQYGPISPAGTWARVADNAVQTPGYYLLLNGWHRIAGDSLFALRAVSLLGGVLAVAVVYRAGAEMLSPMAGLGAAVTLGGSAFYGIYLHEMRTYTLVALSAAAAVWLYWRLINGKADRPTQAGFFLAVLAAPYTHYYALLVPLTIAAYHLLFVRKDRAWWRAPALMAGAAVLFLPWFGVMLRGANGVRTDADRVIYALSPEALTVDALGFFSNGNFALLAVLGVYALTWRKRATWTLWFFALGVLALALGVNFWSKSLSQIRYAMMWWPVLALVAGVGVAAMARAGISPTIVLGVWLAWGVVINLDDDFLTRVQPADWYFEWTDLTEAVLPSAQPDDRVIVQLPPTTGLFGHAPLVDHYLYETGVEGAAVDYPFGTPASDYANRLRDQLEKAPRVWLARDPSQVRGEQRAVFDEALRAEGYAECTMPVREDKLWLTLWAAQPDDFSARFGRDDFSVMAAALPDVPAETGDRLAVSMGWRYVGEVPANTYSYGLHVLDENGALVAQTDAALPGDGCEWATVDLAAVPPGAYTLSLVVYAWQTGDLLDERAMLGSFVRR